ncbi:hypothetical protein SDC9_183173 [bioreactor metagenome]|uniref:Dilute domain-containing protein n=1 Tax=bioreactor metagenome TaxID=1076179 RepID=A0A645H9J3_9ZZZZ
MYDDLRSSLDKEMLNKLKREIKEQNIEEIKIYEWAEKAGLDMEYKYAYKALCADVHTNIRNLNQYTKFDKNNKLTVFDCQPSTRDITETLFTACYILLVSLQCISEVCCLNHDDKFKIFE